MLSSDRWYYGIITGLQLRAAKSYKAKWLGAVRDLCGHSLEVVLERLLDAVVEVLPVPPGTEDRTMREG